MADLWIFKDEELFVWPGERWIEREETSPWPGERWIEQEDTSPWPGEQWIEREDTAQWSEGLWIERANLAADREWPSAGSLNPDHDQIQRPLGRQYCKVPDITDGLGKSKSKKDLVALEELLCVQKLWRVYEKKLCTYDGACWRWLDEHDAEVEIRRTLAEYGYDRCLTSGEYRELRRMLLIKPELQVKQRPTPPEDSVNLLDGTLDLMTGEFRPHDPNDGFFHALQYTSTQIAEATHGPVFESFVEKISGGNPDVRRQLLELVAVLITNRQIKAFFAMLGSSNTGKTQFGRFLAKLLGEERVEALRSMNDFADKWTTGVLKGKRAVMCLDLPDGPLPAEAVGTIKQLVGDDGLKGEYKRGALFTFYDKPILVCAGNHPIRLPNAKREDAFLNRLIIIPFCNPVTEDDMVQGLYNRLLEEAPYIIDQALDVWMDLEGRNFVLTHTIVPEEYHATEGNEHLKAVEAFFQVFIQEEPDAEVSTASVFKAFLLSPMGLGMPYVDFSRLLARVVQDAGSEIIPIKRVAGLDQRGYRGLRVQNDSV